MTNYGHPHVLFVKFGKGGKEVFLKLAYNGKTYRCWLGTWGVVETDPQALRKNHPSPKGTVLPDAARRKLLRAAEFYLQHSAKGSMVELQEEHGNSAASETCPMNRRIRSAKKRCKKNKAQLRLFG